MSQYARGMSSLHYVPVGSYHEDLTQWAVLILTQPHACLPYVRQSIQPMLVCQRAYMPYRHHHRPFTALHCTCLPVPVRFKCTCITTCSASSCFAVGPASASHAPASHGTLGSSSVLGLALGRSSVLGPASASHGTLGGLWWPSAPKQPVLHPTASVPMLPGMTC